MQKTIKGKRYDTEIATEVCKLLRDQPPDRHGFHETTLYRSPKGVFFVCITDAFAILCGKSIRIEVIDRFKAWAIAESANCTADEMKALGFVPEDG